MLWAEFCHWQNGEGPMTERPGRPSWFRDKRPERWGLGDAIRQRREEIGLSRREVAAKAGLSYPYLSELETGKKRGSPDSIRSVAEALGLGQDELWARADELAGAAPLDAVSDDAPPDASLAAPASAAARISEPERDPMPELEPEPRDLAKKLAVALEGSTVEKAEAALLMALGELRYRISGGAKRPDAK
jgi:transcriptional regulator with XRE-family HTH domain